MTITVQCGYILAAHNPVALRTIAENELEGVEFDTVVGTGLSGLLPLAVLADHFGVHFAAIRKPNDSSHAGGDLFEGTLGDRWLFVDDFISSGTTFNRVLETVHKTARDNSHKTECVGALQYDRDERRRFLTFDQIKSQYSRVNRKWSELSEPEPNPAPKPEPVEASLSGDVGGMSVSFLLSDVLQSATFGPTPPEALSDMPTKASIESYGSVGFDFRGTYPFNTYPFSFDLEKTTCPVSPDSSS